MLPDHFHYNILSPAAPDIVQRVNASSVSAFEMSKLRFANNACHMYFPTVVLKLFNERVSRKNIRKKYQKLV